MNENAIDRKLVCAFIAGLISDDGERERGLEYIRSMPPVNPQKPKSEWEYDHAILRAYSDGANGVLDNIRAEIKTKYDSIPWRNNDYDDGWVEALEWVYDDVIDKYKAETEDT